MRPFLVQLALHAHGLLHAVRYAMRYVSDQLNIFSQADDLLLIMGRTKVLGVHEAEGGTERADIRDDSKPCTLTSTNLWSSFVYALYFTPTQNYVRYGTCEYVRNDSSHDRQ
jgi:hypothetical protein